MTIELKPRRIKPKIKPMEINPGSKRENIQITSGVALDDERKPYIISINPKRIEYSPSDRTGNGLGGG